MTILRVRAFDRWVSFKGQGSYLNAEINEDGKDVKPRGYITDILNDYAVEFIKRPHDKPFLIYLSTGGDQRARRVEAATRTIAEVESTGHKSVNIPQNSAYHFSFRTYAGLKEKRWFPDY